MTLDQAAELIAQQKAIHDGSMEITVLQYNGGDDVPCDIVGMKFSEESGTLQLETVYRR